MIKPKQEQIQNLSQTQFAKNTNQSLPNFIHEPGDSIDMQRSVEGGNLIIAKGELGQQNENS